MITAINYHYRIRVIEQLRTPSSHPSRLSQNRLEQEKATFFPICEMKSRTEGTNPGRTQPDQPPNKPEERKQVMN
jgi:hypothetical protein